LTHHFGLTAQAAAADEGTSNKAAGGHATLSHEDLKEGDELWLVKLPAEVRIV
jgi:hypothetical protein